MPLITEPKTSEDGALLQLLADSLSLRVAYVDSSEVYCFVSREYGRWSGLSPADMVGRRVADVLGPKRYAVISEKVREALAGNPCACETQMQLTEGRQTRSWVRFIPQCSAAGAVQGFFVMVEDTGGPEKAAEQSGRRAHRLREHAENLCDPGETLTLQEKKKAADWRGYLEGITGLLPSALSFPESACARISVNGEHFTTEPFSETAWRMESPVRVNGAQIGKVELLYRDQQPPADEGPFRAEERQLIDLVAERVGRTIEHAQDTEALHHAHAHLERCVQGRTTQLEAAHELLLKAIVLQGRIQQELEANRSTLQAVFDSITDPLVLIGPEMDIRMLNQAAIGYYRLECAGNPVGCICHHAFKDLDSPCEGCEVPAALRRGVNMNFERTGFRDPQRTELVHIYPVKGPDNQPRSVLLRISDVTEQKRLQQQVLQSEKLATLGMLATSIAHEITNPNNFISFNLPILQEYFQEVLPILDAHAETHPGMEVARMPYPEFRRDVFDLVENMSHGTERIRAFVAGLKDLSIMKEPRPAEWVQVASVAQKALSICGPQIKKKVRTVASDISPDLPPVWTDAHSLEQILINLLVNAAQAADKEDSRVELRVRTTESRQERLMIEVADNGCGMDAETQRMIFDPFFTTKPRPEGTGLGLYVVRMLVGALQGRLEVESAPGQGSIFRVILPEKDRRGRPRG